jgi:hypothetical protein
VPDGTGADGEAWQERVEVEDGEVGVVVVVGRLAVMEDEGWEPVAEMLESACKSVAH